MNHNICNCKILHFYIVFFPSTCYAFYFYTKIICNSYFITDDIVFYVCVREKVMDLFLVTGDQSIISVHHGGKRWVFWSTDLQTDVSLPGSDWSSSKCPTALIDFDRTRHVTVQMIIISPNDLRATIADVFYDKWVNNIHFSNWPARPEPIRLQAGSGPDYQCATGCTIFVWQMFCFIPAAEKKKRHSWQRLHWA